MNLVFDLEARSTGWIVHGPASQRRRLESPLSDERLSGLAASLRDWASRPVPLDRPDPHGTETFVEGLARKVSDRLTAALLTDEDRRAVAAALAAHRPARLVIRVRSAGPTWDREADAALALPWELLAPEISGAYPVRNGRLAVIREAVTDQAPNLPVPSGPLTLAVTIAAPEDRAAFPYEQESFRLLAALAPLGQRAVFSNLGGLDDLAELVEAVQATAIHFRGHGLPGGLLFEDELGFAREVSVAELRRRLSAVLLDPRRAGSFPGLFFLAAPFIALDAEETSAAAALHRGGFAQVIGFFGPVDAGLNTRLEERFYGALAAGRSALAAVEEARSALLEPVGEIGERVRYPFGWSQLAVYHRGPDLPLAPPGQSGGAPPIPRRTIEVSGLPVLEQGFIGRRGLQHEVRRRVERDGQRLVVIQGLGGLGKTALASQLVRAFAPEPADQLVLRCREIEETDADPVLELRAQAEEHGRLHGLPFWDERVKDLRERVPDPAAGLAAVLRWLRRERPRLALYIDNAETLQSGPATDDPAALGSWRPGLETWWEEMARLADDGCLVIVTTRYAWNDLSRRAHVGLPPMGPADSLRLIDSFAALGDLPLDVRVRLAERVDGHPRTVEFLDRLVAQRRDEVPEVIDAWTDLILPVLPAQEEKIRADLLLEKLWERLSDEAREHARALTVLRRPAPQFVIDRMGEARDELIRAGWLTRYREQVRVESEVKWTVRWGMQGAVRNHLSAEVNRHLPEAHRAAADAWEAWLEKPEPCWEDHAETIYHLHYLGEGDRAWPFVEKLALLLRSEARYREAHDLLAECEAAGVRGEKLGRVYLLRAQMRRNLGDLGPEVASLLHEAFSLASSPLQLAQLLSEQGSLLLEQGFPFAAEASLRRSAAIKEEVAPSDALSLRATLHELGVACATQSKYAEARGLFEECLALVACSEGERHPDYAATLHELGRLEAKQGNYPEAESFLRAALRFDGERFGFDSPLCSTSLHSLAELLVLQGRLAEAENLIRRALDIDASTLESGHPLHADSLHVLADILRRQGSYEEAEKQFLRCLEIKARALGEDHASFGASLQVLACLKHETGRYEEALALARRSEEILSRSLGSDHSETGAAIQRQGIICAKKGLLADAESFARKACAITAKSLGEDHPSHATALQELAWVIQARGRVTEAEGLYRRALVIHEKAEGRDHPSWAAALHSLAQNLERQDRLEEAELFLWRCLDHVEKTLGRNHPRAAEVCDSLAGVVGRQGRTLQAERLFRRAISVFEDEFGPGYPDLMAPLASLAQLVVNHEEFAEAESLLDRALTLARGVQGDQGIDVGRILSIVAKVQFRRGLPEAVHTADQALHVLTVSLGPDHPVTQRFSEERDIILEELQGGGPG